MASPRTVGALRVQSRACGNSCTKGLLIVKGLIAGEEIEAAVNTKAVPVSGSQLRIYVLDRGKGHVTIHPWLDGIYIADCKHPRFVREVYGKGESQTEKESKTVKAMSSHCSSSRDRDYSSNIVGLCCIGKMHEEMDKRWAKAQQEFVVGHEKTTSVMLPKRKNGCIDRQSDGTSDGKVS
ncbi:hypothetical protein Salat_2503000 [Sesamum alatum]|uniref:Uncharacterized protein n=1 Tax=Sesamum alatum TaxID=300844 RepID=A0AAE1XRL5_9LAMI|nr:hypothetical protein Salat_2503000 [Sesamum alatum]